MFAAFLARRASLHVLRRVANPEHADFVCPLARLERIYLPPLNLGQKLGVVAIGLAFEVDHAADHDGQEAIE